MAGNANRNVSVDITGDTRDLESAYDRASKKSDDMARKQDDNNKRLGEGFKRTSEVVTNSFGSMQTVVQGVAKWGPLAIGALAAAIAALPTVINLAAGAITLGFGAALAGVGIAAAVQSAAVRGEFGNLWQDIKTGVFEISGPIQDALLRIRGYIGNAFENFQPYLEKAFQIIGPALDRFGKDWSRAFLELEPAMEPLSSAFAKLLDAIGLRAPEMFGHLSSSIENFSSVVSRNADDIAGFIEGTFGALDWISQKMDEFSSWWDSALADMEDDWNNLMYTLVGDKGIESWRIEIYDNTEQWKLLAEQLRRTADQAAQAQLKLKDLTIDVDALTEAMQELTGVHIAADRAMLNWNQALAKAAALAQVNRDGLVMNTVAGRENWDALLGMAEASNKVIRAKAEEGATARDLAVTYSRLQTDMLNVLRAMGLNSDEARKLTKRYLEIPDEIRTKVGLETNEAQRRFDEYITLNSGRQIPVYLIQKQEMPAKDGGYFGYASGGPVRGPGGSRTDSIPARISRGEYIVNAAATRRNLPLLESINSGKGVGGMGTTIIYQINTSVAPTANLSAVGQEIVESIQAFESRSGKTWRSN